MQICKNFLKVSFISTFIFSAHADFVNGSFEAPITTGWTSNGYLFTGYAPGLVLPPKSLSDIILTPATAVPSGINDRINGPTQSLYEYFLEGATPTTSLLLPESGNYSAVVNLRPITTPNAISGTSGTPPGWLKYAKLATALSQSISVSGADRSLDGNVHVRFKLAAVMENPEHTAKQQPFYAVVINNLNPNNIGQNPLFFQWSYAGQPGVPWNVLATKGTNPGSNAIYNYLDWQNFDVSLSPAQVSNGDELELIVLAAGCSPGGHDGHVYLDSVTTQTPTSGLGVTATGPSEVRPGEEIAYVYTFENFSPSGSGVNFSNVCVEAHLPVTQNTNPPYETVFASSTSITIDGATSGSCSYTPSQSYLTCCLNGGVVLEPTKKGTFEITFKVPETWQPNYGPINNGNFPVSATDYNPVLGNLVQTAILDQPPPVVPDSYLVIDLSGLQIDGKDPVLQSGVPYTGSYTCSNTGQYSASPASCDISNLPDGLSVSGCTYNDGTTDVPWVSPFTIEPNKIITCNVSGTVTSDISREFIADVSSNAANNLNNVTNHGSMPFYIYAPDPAVIPATLNGSPVLSPIKICCGRPVAIFDLPIESDVPAIYEIIETTGNVKCRIGKEGNHQYVKVFGKGTCTILGKKDGQISAPLVLKSN